jgi:hypothetical protein
MGSLSSKTLIVFEELNSELIFDVNLFVDEQPNKIKIRIRKVLLRFGIKNE